MVEDNIPRSGFRHCFIDISLTIRRKLIYIYSSFTVIQGDSLTRGPKLLSLKNYVIEIMG
jgi:hypothetical protein